MADCASARTLRVRASMMDEVRRRATRHGRDDDSSIPAAGDHETRDGGKPS